MATKDEAKGFMPSKQMRKILEPHGELLFSIMTNCSSMVWCMKWQ